MVIPASGVNYIVAMFPSVPATLSEVVVNVASKIVAPVISYAELNIIGVVVSDNFKRPSFVSSSQLENT